MRFSTEAPPVAELSASHDLVIAADGINSVVRDTLAEHFGPTLDRRQCKFMWLGTDLVFEAFTFHIVETEYGVFQIHGYPYDETMSTFIVETDEETWRRAGLDAREAHPFAPGENDEESIAFCRELFADILGDHTLVANNSRWLNFNTVRNAHWSHENVVLLGDAAHTAHFSIGSGTKLAMEDAIALAWAFRDRDDVRGALTAYEEERRSVVESTQRAAQASLEWFEGIARYVGQEPSVFAFNLLTRSRRITYDNLRVRDPGFVASVDDDFTRSVQGSNGRGPIPPMFLPFRLRDLVLPNRVVVSPMDMYTAVDGAVSDFHLVHLGARAVGGAALVMTEMICTSAEGRITPGCGGLYRDDHVVGWQRIVDFVHTHGTARIGAQIGHSGRKGSTKLMWEGMDEPLEGDGWPVLAPSPLPFFDESPLPREMTRADMDRVRDEFVFATHRAAECGFDLLELHMAHGYLLSSFLSPLTNRRQDEYGGTLAERARFPLEVLDACRAAWPAEKPLSVRISATDWHPGGFEAEDAVELARMLRAHDVDVVDVSTGQVWPDGQAGVRAQLPDAVRRPDPQRGRRPDHRRRGDLELRRRQHDDPRRPRRPVRARSPAPLRPLLDAARRRRAGLRRHAVDRPVPGGQPAADGRPPRRAQAAAAVLRSRRRAPGRAALEAGARLTQAAASARLMAKPPKAVSSAAAPASARSSRQGAAAIWTPIGNPSSVATGTTATGTPATALTWQYSNAS